MNIRHFIIFLILSARYSSNISAVETQVGNSSEEILINRSVLILDFMNTQNSRNYDYLKVSIPDAFKDPLDSTKQFELLSRELGRKRAVEMGISDFASEENALKIARNIGADVVVLGSFIVIGSKIKIQAMALEVKSGRVAISRSTMGKTDSTIFQAIDKLATGLSSDMAKDLKPIPQREKIIVQSKGKIFRIAVFDLAVAGVKEDTASSTTALLDDALLKTGYFEIAARTELSKILREQGLTEAGAVTEEKAVRIGKLLGVEKVVLGKVSKIGAKIQLSVRLISVNTANTDGAAEKVVDSETNLSSATVDVAEQLKNQIGGTAIVSEKQERKEVQATPILAEAAPIRGAFFLEFGLPVLQTLYNSDGKITYEGKYPFNKFTPGVSVFANYFRDMPDFRALSYLKGFKYGIGLGYSRYSANFEVISSGGIALLQAEPMTLQCFEAQMFLGKQFTIWRFITLPFAGVTFEYSQLTASKGEYLFNGGVPGAIVGGRMIFYTIRNIDLGISYSLGIKFMNESNIYLNHSIRIAGGYSL